MKVALVLSLVVGVISAGIVPEINNLGELNKDYIVFEKEDGTIIYEDLRNSTVEVYASASDVTYYFYSRNYRNGVSFKSTTINNLRTSTDYNPSKPLLFSIHGWTNSYRSEVNVLIREAALAAADMNVIVVDWSPVSRRGYVTAQSAVKQIGDFVGAVINQLNANFGQSWDSITVSGHSLGAHIAGNTGAATGGRVGTVVGLDPAGPLFSSLITSNRIDPTDGQYVQIIHSDDGGYGFGITMGHSDFFPNGGKSQPGCLLSGLCDHSRAYFYYAESFTNNNFLGRSCSTYSAWNLRLCSTRATALMGGLVLNRQASGSYFMDTNSRSPFAKGSA